MFERIAVPTPFQVGRVNAYVAGRTVIDPGPDSDKAWSTLEDGLAGVGLTPDDIERVIITHGHLDHFGLAERFKDRGADILAHPAAAAVMRDFLGHLQEEQAFFAPFFERCGVDPDISETVVTLPEPYVSYACDVETDQLLTAGDTLEIDGTTMEVRELSGHGPGELAFAFETGGEQRAIVGDAVLPHITPNPLLMPPDDGEDDWPRQVVNQNETLRRFRTLDFDSLLPGHADVIDDPDARIGEILEANEQRTATVRELVDGPTEPIDVLEGLFGDLPLTEMFGGMSEAVGHLDLLVERDQLERVADPETLQYRPV